MFSDEAFFQIFWPARRGAWAGTGARSQGFGFGLCLLVCERVEGVKVSW